MKKIFSSDIVCVNVVTGLLVLMLSASSIYAQPAYQSFVTNVGDAATATINKPAATVSGDLLLIGFAFDRGSTETVTPPAGWTLIRRTDNGNNCGIATYYKVAGASEPASYSFSLLDGSKWSIGISRITSAASSPIDVSAGLIGSGASAAAPSVTTLGSNRLVISFYTNRRSSTYTPDATTTERYDQPNAGDGRPSNMMATFVQVSSGATGNKNAIASDADSWATQQIAVTPLSVLPVKFKSFHVSYNKDVRILWSAFEGINAAYYEVQRSADGASWTAIGTVQAAATNKTNYYSYFDKEPFGPRLFYRIKQVDRDGSSVCTPVRVINVASAAAIQISSTSNKVTVHFRQRIKGQVYVQLVSMNGQTFSTQAFVDPSGQVVINPLAALKGYFIVTVSDSKTVHTAKQVFF